MTGTETFAKGDRVYRWFDTGAFGASVQPLTIVKVCPRTFRVRTDQGSEFLIPHRMVEGRYEDDDA